jgi:hypothetical protein
LKRSFRPTLRWLGIVAAVLSVANIGAAVVWSGRINTCLRWENVGDPDGATCAWHKMDPARNPFYPWNEFHVPSAVVNDLAWGVNFLIMWAARVWALGMVVVFVCGGATLLAGGCVGLYKRLKTRAS